MKFRFIIFILSCAFSISGNAQTKTTINYNVEVDDLMDEKNDSLTSLSLISDFINRSFKTDENKCRAIFYWITKNISYAPELLYTYQTRYSNSKAVKEIMTNRSGICSGYAALTDTLCKLTGLQSYLIEGSTKQSFLPAIIGHAWNAVKVNGNWKIMDATWGSGYIKNQKFVQSRHNNFFFPEPSQIISTHLPFDPIWQLLERPVTLHQFFTAKGSTMTEDWNYKDSVEEWIKLPEIRQLAATIRRLNEFGTNSEVTFNYLNYLKSKESDYYIKKLNNAGKIYNQASDLFNEYINFKNKQFTPIKADTDIAKMMPAINELLTKSKEEMNSVPKQFTETNTSYLESMEKHNKELSDRIVTETAFINKYLATKKARRKELFYVRIY